MIKYNQNSKILKMLAIMEKNLKAFDLFILSLMIVSLPSVEAPKNFF